MVHSLAVKMLTSAYEKMFLIRTVESEISRRYAEGKMRCPTHLSIGQESTPSFLANFIRNSDYAVSTHRSHAHYLAKGGDLLSMLAEIYGLPQGCAGGRGGSMHLVDKAVGFMGSSAIVGNSIPIGTGLGHAKKLDGTDDISVVYFGDGAVEEGSFYESANYAATAHLPVLFVCENNGYSVYTGMDERQPENRAISKMVSGLGILSFQVSSYHPVNLMETLERAVSHCRSKRSPCFVEIETDRYLEHCGPNQDDHLGYRDVGLVAKHKANDPLSLVRSMLSDKKISVKKIEAETEAYVQEAFKRIEFLQGQREEAQGIDA